jgi:hypothetical protein
LGETLNKCILEIFYMPPSNTWEVTSYKKSEHILTQCLSAAQAGLFQGWWNSGDRPFTSEGRTPGMFQAHSKPYRGAGLYKEKKDKTTTTKTLFSEVAGRVGTWGRP